MENRLGQQFGEYRLSEFKGRGASGDVYVGTSLDGSKQAAVKILKEPLTSMQDVQAFLSEARVFLHFNNDPYIVHLLDFGVTTSGIAFLVLQYARKGSLRQNYPKGTCLPLPTIVRYVKQAATALQNIHKQGFVHRDVKPDNILLNEHDEILLSDFGITIPSFTKKLAVLAYEWLCGAPPFTGRTCENLAVQHIKMPPPPFM